MLIVLLSGKGQKWHQNLQKEKDKGDTNLSIDDVDTKQKVSLKQG